MVMRLKYYLSMLFWLPISIIWFREYKRLRKQVIHKHNWMDEKFPFSDFWVAATLQLEFIRASKQPVAVVLPFGGPELQAVTIWITAKAFDSKKRLDK